MKFLKSLINNFKRVLKIILLWDLQSDLSYMQQFKILIAFLFSISNSIAKIIAPAALAKAIQMIATSEENTQVGTLSLHAKDLLFISVSLTVWTKAELHIKKFLIRNMQDRIIQKKSMHLIKASHETSYRMHNELRGEITKSLMDIINMQSKLGGEIIAVVHQGLLDVIIATSLIWSRYGNVIGSEFLVYCLLDLVILNHLVDYFTGQSARFRKNNKALHKFINREYENVNSETTIRMFNHQELETELSEQCLQKYISAMRSYERSENLAAVLKLIPFIAANMIPMSFIMKENITIQDLDDFVFLLSYINIFGGNMLNLNQSIRSCLHAVKSIENTNNVINTAKYNRDEQQSVYPPIPRPLLTNNYPSPEVVFENVYFTYPNSRQPTLKGVSFKLRPGLKIGLIGRSNAGKSTIVKLLYGMYKVQHGVIKINDHPIHTIPTQTLTKIFCTVPQNLDLFKEKSLKYNVIYGTPRHSLLKDFSQIKFSKKQSQSQPNYQTIDSAHQSRDAFSMEQGIRGEWDLERGPLSTYGKASKIFSEAVEKAKLKELDNTAADYKNGILQLSGGQQQRVSIARAMTRNSCILLLDEATSSLDIKTECEVLQNVHDEAKDKTVLIITHRLSTVKNADEIIVLDKGKVAEKGSPRDLFEKKGLYYEYYTAQMGCTI